MKKTEISPVMPPSRMYQGMFLILKAPATVKESKTSSPIRKYATVAAVTAEIIRGTIDAIVRSSNSTSSVNTIPATGALKIPATAPAAPHPISSVTLR